MPSHGMPRMSTIVYFALGFSIAALIVAGVVFFTSSALPVPQSDDVALAALQRQVKQNTTMLTALDGIDRDIAALSTDADRQAKATADLAQSLKTVKPGAADPRIPDILQQLRMIDADMVAVLNRVGLRHRANLLEYEMRQ